MLNYKFTIFLLWLTTLAQFRLCRPHACNYVFSNGLAADCTQKGLLTVPQNLDPKIKALSLNGNPIDNLNKDMFVMYIRIQKLFLRTCYIEIIQEETFVELTYLEQLDLSGNPFKTLPTFPQSLLILQLDIITPDLRNNLDSTFPTDLNLLAITLNYNRLNRFPKFLANLTSLQLVTLTGNQITMVTVTEMAPLCNLKSLDLSENSQLYNNESSICECHMVHIWAREFNINIVSNYSADCLTNTNFENYNIDHCNFTIPYDAIKTRESCIEANRLKRYRNMWHRIFKFSLVVFTILILLTCAVCYCCRQRNSSRTLKNYQEQQMKAEMNRARAAHLNAENNR